MRPIIRPREHPKQGEVATLGLMHEMAVARAVTEFEIGHRREPYITPFLWLIRYPNDLVVIETPWSNDAEKVNSLTAMRMMMQCTGATAYSFIHESWMAAFTTPEDKEKYKDLYSVRSLPPDKREDVLLILSYDRSGQYLYTRFGMNRPDTPHATLKVRDDHALGSPGHDGGGLFGRLNNMLLRPESDR